MENLNLSQFENSFNKYKLTCPTDSHHDIESVVRSVEVHAVLDELFSTVAKQVNFDELATFGFAAMFTGKYKRIADDQHFKFENSVKYSIAEKGAKQTAVETMLQKFNEDDTAFSPYAALITLRIDKDFHIDNYLKVIKSIPERNFIYFKLVIVGASEDFHFENNLMSVIESATNVVFTGDCACEFVRYNSESTIPEFTELKSTGNIWFIKNPKIKIPYTTYHTLYHYTRTFDYLARGEKSINFSFLFYTIDKDGDYQLASNSNHFTIDIDTEESAAKMLISLITGNVKNIKNLKCVDVLVSVNNNSDARKVAIEALKELAAQIKEINFMYVSRKSL